MQVRTDTIAALSTPPGRSALAIVRVSGPDAHPMVRRLVARWPERARECVLTAFRAPEGDGEIDSLLLTRFDAPASFTGEPMVELSCHGGAMVPQELLRALIAAGIRQAEPGEFTQRAVLNGKLDLLQAEAIGDVIDARTTAQRRVATAHLHGGLTRQVGALRNALLDLEALLAYDVDFPEEDDGPVSRERVRAGAGQVREALERLQATAPLMDVLKTGAVVVIAGPPNAGKSSLFNALIGSERAIVTEIPGTTRDALEVTLERPEWPLHLVDTAGLRDTADRLERLGIEVSERHIREAHVVLACGASGPELAHARGVVAGLTTAPVIPVLTKQDAPTIPADADEAVSVSAHTRAGLDTLLSRLDATLHAVLGSLPVDGAMLTRARHQHAVARALSEVRLFEEAWDRGALPATVAAVHVRSAVHALDELVGTIDVEDVLTRVFQTFCVGK